MSRNRWNGVGWGNWGNEGGRKWSSLLPSFPSPTLCFLSTIHSPSAEAHLVEGVEVPFAHMLFEDPGLRREGKLDPSLAMGLPQGQ